MGAQAFDARRLTSANSSIPLLPRASRGFQECVFQWEDVTGGSNGILGVANRTALTALTIVHRDQQALLLQLAFDSAEDAVVFLTTESRQR